MVGEGRNIGRGEEMGESRNRGSHTFNKGEGGYKTLDSV